MLLLRATDIHRSSMLEIEKMSRKFSFKFLLLMQERMREMTDVIDRELQCVYCQYDSLLNSLGC
jgi:hypothetical protein